MGKCMTKDGRLEATSYGSNFYHTLGGCEIIGIYFKVNKLRINSTSQFKPTQEVYKL